MRKQTDGGPAFPNPDRSLPSNFPGMNLRDYFAAKALAAIIAKSPLVRVRNGKDPDPECEEEVARGAYCYADAMLKARENDGTP